MIPRSDINQIIQWLDAIETDGINLTVWEEGFIEDMKNKVEMYGDRVLFSDKQAEHIEKIYADRVST